MERPIDAVLQAELAWKLACADKHGTTIETYQAANEIMVRIVSQEQFYCVCWCVTRTLMLCALWPLLALMCVL